MPSNDMETPTLHVDGEKEENNTGTVLEVATAEKVTYKRTSSAVASWSTVPVLLSACSPST